MGVGGLTSFVDDNNHLLQDHRLHDTKVVIDGNNLYHFLYFYYSVNYRYGGNLNDFAECVATYFNNLHTCMITPYVVFDGAYAVDDSKLKTVMKRARDKIVQSEAISKGQRGKLIPALASDVFKNTLSALGIEHVTCSFEADDQIAALANAWGCPVMSNDSDFFIFDLKGGFIVFDYVNLNILTGDRASDENGATEKYKYLSVQIYFTKNLISVLPSLDISMLPLFACLYGNDIVNRTYFDSFYANVNFPSLSNLAAVWSSPGRKHDKILKLLLWLDGADSRQVAMRTVLKHIAADTKIDIEKVRDLMNSSIASYSIIEGYLDTYFETGEIKCLGESAPDMHKLESSWFLTAARKARIHTFILNVFFVQRALLRCQVEDVKSASAYRCALPLRQIAYSIVCGRNNASIDEYDREGRDYRCYAVALMSALPSGRTVPNLDEIPLLSHSDKFAFLVDAFGVKDMEAMRNVDSKLALVILAIAYWVKKASPVVNKLHMQSVLMCMIKIGLDLKMYCKYDAGHPLHSAFDECPPDVLLLVQDNLNKLSKVPSSSSQFYIKNIHAVAQFQSVLLGALELNSVLQDVVPPPCPSHILCGTFLYNMYKELHMRTNPKSYVSHLLGKSTQLVALMDRLVDTVSQFIPRGALESPSGVKSRKTRKQKPKTIPAQSAAASTDEDEPSADDVAELAGNRFSLLVLQNGRI